VLSNVSVGLVIRSICVLIGRSLASGKSIFNEHALYVLLFNV
jgi:hypothetical protein